MFDLLLKNFTYLDFVFLFFVSLNNFILAKLNWPIFDQLHYLILRRFRENTFFTLPSTLFKLVVLLPLGLMKFHFF